jgi:hypothetical protein
VIEVELLTLLLPSNPAGEFYFSYSDEGTLGTHSVTIKGVREGSDWFLSIRSEIPGKLLWGVNRHKFSGNSYNALVEGINLVILDLVRAGLPEYHVLFIKGCKRFVKSK